MTGAQNLVGRLLLRAPSPIRAVRSVPLLGNLLHRLSYRLLPTGQFLWAQVQKGAAQGIWLELNPRTGQGYWQGQGETAVQQALVERLRPGMVFYDLGANIGFFTLLAARLVGPQGKVFSFEPDPEALARLKRNVERNGFAQVTIINKGVWSSTGTAGFFASGAASPDRGLGKLAEGQARGDMQVACIALDDFLLDAPPPDAIKCDVEGAEVEVIRGAEALCKKHKPWIICETHSDENRRSLEDLLSRYGYRGRSLDDQHLLALP